ncbi:hypothetical protein OSTOST_00819, partial [Ostertagia ostertagi]
LLTRYGNKLEHVIKEKGLTLESLRAELYEEAQKVSMKNLRRLEEAMEAIGTPTATLRGVSPTTKKTYSIQAGDSIATAVEYMMLLQTRIRAIKSWDGIKSIRDRGLLFEQIQVIIQQARQKGEQDDNQWMMKNILSKFPEEFQRKVFMRKRSVPSHLQPLSMQCLAASKDCGTRNEQPALKKRTPQNRILPCMRPQTSPVRKIQDFARTRTIPTRRELVPAMRISAPCNSRLPQATVFSPHHTSCCFMVAVNSTTSSTLVSGTNSHQERGENSQRAEKRGEKNED